MEKQYGVKPNGSTYRTLVRMHILNKDIDAAVKIKQDMVRHHNYRVSPFARLLFLVTPSLSLNRSHSYIYYIPSNDALCGMPATHLPTPLPSLPRTHPLTYLSSIRPTNLPTTRTDEGIFATRRGDLRNVNPKFDPSRHGGGKPAATRRSHEKSRGNRRSTRTLSSITLRFLRHQTPKHAVGPQGMGKRSEENATCVQVYLETKSRACEECDVYVMTMLLLYILGNSNGASLRPIALMFLYSYVTAILCNSACFVYIAGARRRVPVVQIGDPTLLRA